VGSVPFQRSYTNFSGGVHRKLPPVLPDTEEAFTYSEYCENWYPSEEGLLKAPGFVEVLTAALGAPIRGLFEYRNPVGNNELIACAGGGIYLVSGNSSTLLLGSQDADAYYQVINWADSSTGDSVVLLMNGVDPVVVYDGTTASAITMNDPDSIWNDARPYAADIFRGRIFYWDRQTIYTPIPGTYDNFDRTTSESDAFNVDPGYGGFITGVKALTDNFLVIYKEFCIRRLSGVSPFGTIGTEPFEIGVVTNDFGCIAPRAIVQVGLDHYFLTEDGLRQLRTTQNYGDIDPSQPTYPLQDVINSLNFANPSVIRAACAVFDRDSRHIWLSVPDGSNNNNNLIIGYNVLTKGLYVRPDGDIQANALTTYNRNIYHGDESGQVYVHGNANGNNGDPMNCTYESKWIAHLGLGTYKRYKDVFIYADADGAGDVIVQWRILKRGEAQERNNTLSVSTGGDVWDSALWDEAKWSAGSQNVLHLKNLGRGNAIKFRFLSSSASQRMKIRQVDIMGEGFGRSLG
jgi:hypothetical protein